MGNIGRGDIQYKKEYCQMLIEHMKQGYSFTTFSSIAKVSRKTLYEWVEQYEEFKEAKTIASDLAKMFFESRLIAKLAGQEIKGIDTKKIDITAVIFALKTRFHKDYGDKSKLDISASEGIKITIDQQDNDL